MAITMDDLKDKLGKRCVVVFESGRSFEDRLIGWASNKYGFYLQFEEVGWVDISILLELREVPEVRKH